MNSAGFSNDLMLGEHGLLLQIVCFVGMFFHSVAVFNAVNGDHVFLSLFSMDGVLLYRKNDHNLRK